MRPWTRIFVSVALFIFLLGLSIPVTAQGNNVAVHENLSKENKALLLNAAVGAAILTWGLLSWDYGDRSPHFRKKSGSEKTLRKGVLINLGICTSHMP